MFGELSGRRRSRRSFRRFKKRRLPKRDYSAVYTKLRELVAKKQKIESILLNLKTSIDSLNSRIQDIERQLTTATDQQRTTELQINLNNTTNFRDAYIAKYESTIQVLKAIINEINGLKSTIRR